MKIVKKINLKNKRGVIGWNVEVKQLREQYSALEMQIDALKRKQKRILAKIKKAS